MKDTCVSQWQKCVYCAISDGPIGNTSRSDGMEREQKEDSMEEDEEEEEVYNIGVGIGDVTGPAAEIAMVSENYT